MHQQINLYQPVFRKQLKVFSATTLAQITGAVLVLLLMVYTHARWTLASMEQDARLLQQQQDHIRSQLGTLEADYRTPDTAALDTEIEQLQADIDQRKYLLARFNQLAIEHRSGFAGKFRALAEQRLSGLWLEGVLVDEEGRIELRGITLDDRLVPVYLQQLGKHKGLTETPFETLSMQRIEPGQPHIQFVLLNQKDTSR